LAAIAINSGSDFPPKRVVIVPLKFSDHDENQLVLYQKYSRKDICRLLNWSQDDSSTIYGYKIKHGTCPIFVTYEKQDDISNSMKYADEFINNKRFSWMTRSRVTLESREAQYKMKTIQAVAAIIQRDNRVLATQRGYGDLKDSWETPER